LAGSHPLEGELPLARRRQNQRQERTTLRKPGDLMGSSVDPDIVTTILAPSAQRAPHDDRDPWLLMGADAVMAFPLAGQPGHGRTAFVRRQPVRIVSGRLEGGYTNVFELICPSCGDHPYLDYSEIPLRLQWLRGPRSLTASLAAYHKHLDPHTDSAASLGPSRARFRGSQPRRLRIE